MKRFGFLERARAYWRITAEMSLAVLPENVRLAAGVIDEFIV